MNANNKQLGNSNQQFFNKGEYEPNWKGDASDLYNYNIDDLSVTSEEYKKVYSEACDILFSGLDKSMKETVLELAKYKSGLPISQELLKKLSLQYNVCKAFLDWRRDGNINEPYVFKETDLDMVRNILLENGYLDLDQSKMR